MPKPQVEKIAEPCAWITRGAMFLLLAVVCARCGLAEVLRDPSPVVPGQVSPPRGPGPAAGIGLDLLLWIPGLLVLVRRMLDREYRVRLPWSLVPLAGLSLWAVASVGWAADKFAAMVNAFHLIGAGGVMFAAVQLVRERGPRSSAADTGVRLVAGAAVGIMLMLLANGVNKRLVEMPENIRQWNDHDSPNSRWRYMQEHDVQEGDFQFQQIEKKIQGGELTGFSASANTYAAMIAVGLVVMFGVAAQALGDGRKWWWVIVVGVGAVAVFVLRYTHSRQAAITPVLGLSSLLLMRWKGQWLAARATAAYWAGVGVFVVGACALVGHGMYHGSLGDRSLTFRWYYWTGAAQIFRERPLAGVGWANFGDYYPAVRVARATEEVQDPHNILVRAFAELGMVGGVLLAAWLMRLFWEMTCAERPASMVDGGHRRDGDATKSGRAESVVTANDAGHRRDACATKRHFGPVGWAVGVAVAAMGVNMLAGHDFSQNAAWLELQSIYALGAAVLLALGMLAAAGNGWPVRWDGAGGEWIVRGVVVAAGIFFIHNLVDFSWSEPAPLCFFMLLAGAAVGARQKVGRSNDITGETPVLQNGAGIRPQWAVVSMGGVAVAMWLASLAFVWRPTYVAEEHAAAADARWRGAGAGGAGSDFASNAAAEGYAAAFETMRLNADYRQREAQVRAWRRELASAAAACEEAIRVNPRAAKYDVFRADIELSGEKPDAAVVKRAMESAIALDPRQVFLHVHYGDALLRLGEKEGARREYARALALDDELPEKEPKRMPAARRKEIEKKAAAEHVGVQSHGI